MTNLSSRIIDDLDRDLERTSPLERAGFAPGEMPTRQEISESADLTRQAIEAYVEDDYLRSRLVAQATKAESEATTYLTDREQRKETLQGCVLTVAVILAACAAFYFLAIRPDMERDRKERALKLLELRSKPPVAVTPTEEPPPTWDGYSVEVPLPRDRAGRVHLGVLKERSLAFLDEDELRAMWKAVSPRRGKRLTTEEREARLFISQAYSKRVAERLAGVWEVVELNQGEVYQIDKSGLVYHWKKRDRYIGEMSSNAGATQGYTGLDGIGVLAPSILTETVKIEKIIGVVATSMSPVRGERYATLENAVNWGDGLKSADIQRERPSNGLYERFDCSLQWRVLLEAGVENELANICAMWKEVGLDIRADESEFDPGKRTELLGTGVLSRARGDARSAPNIVWLKKDGLPVQPHAGWKVVNGEEMTIVLEAGDQAEIMAFLLKNNPPER